MLTPITVYNVSGRHAHTAQDLLIQTFGRTMRFAHLSLLFTGRGIGNAEVMYVQGFEGLGQLGGKSMFDEMKHINCSPMYY